MHTTNALALILILLIVVQVHGYADGLTICSITESAMATGMGGNNTVLGYTINADVDPANSTTVTVMVQNEQPGSQWLHGLLLWATDADGARTGTWTVPTSLSDTYSPVPTCAGGAIAHSGGGRNRSLTTIQSSDGFKFEMSNHVKMPVFLHAVVVQERTSWQLITSEPVEGPLGLVMAATAGAKDKTEERAAPEPHLIVASSRAHRPHPAVTMLIALVLLL